MLNAVLSLFLRLLPILIVDTYCSTLKKKISSFNVNIYVDVFSLSFRKKLLKTFKLSLFVPSASEHAEPSRASKYTTIGFDEHLPPRKRTRTDWIQYCFSFVVKIPCMGYDILPNAAAQPGKVDIWQCTYHTSQAGYKWELLCIPRTTH